MTGRHFVVIRSVDDAVAMLREMAAPPAERAQA